LFSSRDKNTDEQYHPPRLVGPGWQTRVFVPIHHDVSFAKSLSDKSCFRRRQFCRARRAVDEVPNFREEGFDAIERDEAVFRD
jgi:hypothetical protein